MSGNISDLLKQIRSNAKLNQRKIGQLLGITQSMISQIESGAQHPSREVAEKIRDLAQRYQPSSAPAQKQIELKRMLKTWKRESVEFSLLEIPYQNQSADFFSAENSGHKTLMLIGDSFGHGDDASHMARAIGFGYSCIRKTINADILTPASVVTILSAAYRSSENTWAGPPSMMAIQIDVATGDIELVNDGMPSLAISNKDGEISAADKARFNIPLGGTVIAFSDGFVDMFEDPVKMQERFWKVAKSYKGDAQAIMLNLMKASKIDGNGNVNLRDDVTALVIARSRSLE